LSAASSANPAEWPALPSKLQGTSRAVLRRHFRHTRRQLDPDTQQQHALAACRHVLGSGLLLSQRRIGLYLATTGTGYGSAAGPA
jgi:hypothetical protein